MIHWQVFDIESASIFSIFSLTASADVKTAGFYGVKCTRRGETTQVRVRVGIMPGHKEINKVGAGGGRGV